MKLLLTILTAITLTIGLTAKPGKGGKGDKSGRPSREEMIKKFDKDGDGKLNDEEKTAIRKEMMANRTPPPTFSKNLIKTETANCATRKKPQSARK
jgi:hypothetical protein